MRSLIASFFLLTVMGFAQNPMTSPFPTSLDSDTTLAVACNSARTTLTVALTNSTSALTIQVADSSKFCTPSYIDIEGEMIKLCSKATGVLTACSGGRAIHGGIANHGQNAPVVVRPDENYHNGLAAAMKAVQNALQANLAGVLTPTRDLTFASDGVYNIGGTSSGRPLNVRLTGDVVAGGAGNFGSWKVGGTYITSSATSISLSAATHNGQALVTTATSAITITVPASLGTFSVLVIQGNTGQITFSAGGGVFLYNPDTMFKSKGQGAMMTVTCWASNTCAVAGNLQQ